METILSFDVGIIHLAYCFFTKKEYKEKDLSGNEKSVYKWDIIDWSLIDLTDRDELKCLVCNKIATLQQTDDSILKYYCKVHAKQVNSKPLPYDEIYDKLEKKKIGGCCFILEASNCCDKNCTIKDKNNNTFCGAHAKKIYQTLTNDIKMKPLKKINVSSMDFDDTRLKLINILENKKHLLNADVVVIENQPSFKNPRMKSISALLYDYYIIRGVIDKEITNSNIKRVKFMSPSNKIKLASEGDTNQLIKLKATDESKAYKLTKSLGIKYTLEMVKHLPNWLAIFNSHKKKDDLADAFLQGAYYFEMNVKLDDDTVYKKKGGKAIKKPIIEIDTNNKTIEL